MSFSPRTTSNSFLASPRVVGGSASPRGINSVSPGRSTTMTAPQPRQPAPKIPIPSLKLPAKPPPESHNRALTLSPPSSAITNTSARSSSDEAVDSLPNSARSLPDSTLSTVPNSARSISSNWSARGLSSNESRPSSARRPEDPSSIQRSATIGNNGSQSMSTGLTKQQEVEKWKLRCLKLQKTLEESTDVRVSKLEAENKLLRDRLRNVVPEYLRVKDKSVSQRLAESEERNKKLQLLLNEAEAQLKAFRKGRESRNEDSSVKSSGSLRSSFSSGSGYKPRAFSVDGKKPSTPSINAPKVAWNTPTSPTLSPTRDEDNDAKVIALKREVTRLKEEASIRRREIEMQKQENQRLRHEVDHWRSIRKVSFGERLTPTLNKPSEGRTSSSSSIQQDVASTYDCPVSEMSILAEIRDAEQCIKRLLLCRTKRRAVSPTRYRNEDPQRNVSDDQEADSFSMKSEENKPADIPVLKLLNLHIKKPFLDKDELVNRAKSENLM